MPVDSPESSEAAMLDFDAAQYLDPDGQPIDGAPMGMLLSAWAARQPEAMALALGERLYSFAQMDAAANRFARHLAGCGMKAGDKAVLSMPNRAELIQAVFGLWKIGAVPALISYRLSAQEFGEIVELVDPFCVIGDHVTHRTGRRFVNVEQALPEGICPAPLPPAVSTPGKILASGGSTGRPKLIIDPIASAWGRDKAVPYRPGGVTLLNAGPIYHTAPFSFCTVAMAEGSHIVCMEKFDAADWLAQVARYRPSLVCLVPTMMSRITKLPAEVLAKADLSSIDCLLHVAAACPPDIKRWWIDRLGPEKIYEVYGGTERLGATGINGVDWLTHPGSVGRPIPGDEILILDDQGAELPPHQVGEIHFRRASGTGTHYRYIGSETRIRDGLDSFGDMGWLDEDGFLYIADRRTDMVVVAGVNIYPAEVEAALESIPGVLCSAVIGLPDADLGNRLHAIVELAEGTKLPADGLEFLAPALAQLAVFKRPRSVEFTRERIRDDAGKVRRGALRAARLPPQ
jgi:bile acid-coenzyme A ligase